MRDTTWAKKVLEKVILKENAVVKRNFGKIPYSAQNHAFDDKSGDDICWWTNGFYAGMLWQLYKETGNEDYRASAEKIEEKLDENLMIYQRMDHDSGFKWLLTAVADYKLTGSDKSKNRGLIAAANLAGRYNLQGRFIRAWNDWGEESKNRGWAIIDCMMNLPLLYWAGKTLDDPRFVHIAVSHADTAMEYFIRENGSSRHIVEINTDKHEFIREYGGQGYSEGTAWTRGQTWAIYGFIISYMHTGDKKYLETSIKVADFFVDHIPESGIIPVDFLQPQLPAYEDSTAAAIASCGLLQLSEEMSALGLTGGEKYYEAAVKLLKTLSKERCDFNEDHDELLINCSAAYHDKEHHFPIIYGDYYFLEALLFILGKGIFLW